MSINKTKAVVLGSTNLVGADKIVAVYSPDYGQIRGVAHGIKRIKNRFGSALEPLTHINLIFKSKANRELQLFQQADLIDNFESIRHDLIPLTSGLYAAELVQKLTPLEGNGQPELYQLILKALELIADKADISSILRVFEVRLLDLLGYRPNLEKCLGCPATQYTYGWGFSPSMGGLICPLCRSKYPDSISISPGGIMFLRQALNIDIERIGRLRIIPSGKREAERMLQASLSQYLASPLKSYPVLRSLLG